MADELKAIEPNLLGLMLSQGLRKGRDVLNYPGKLPESVPLLGGQGAGDIVMGKAPEAIEDYSYGFGPLGHGKGLTTRVDPRIVDVAGLPTLGAGGAIVKGGNLAKEALTAAALRELPDVGRREFLKQAGAIGAAGAASAATPGVVKVLAKGAEKEAIPKIATTAARVATKFNPTAILAHGSNWIKKHADDFAEGAEWDIGSEEMAHAFEKLHKDPEAIKLIEQLHAEHGEEGAKNLVQKAITLGQDGPLSPVLEEAYAKESKRYEKYFAEHGPMHSWPYEVAQEYARHKPATDVYAAAEKWAAENPKLVEKHYATGTIPKGMPPEYAHTDFNPHNAKNRELTPFEKLTKIYQDHAANSQNELYQAGLGVHGE